MNNLTRILLFFVLPLFAVMSYPPEIYLNELTGLYLLILVAAVFALLAFLLYRGSGRALTLSIFIQGLNVIIRIMMFFPHSVSRTGTIDWTFMTFSLLGLVLSSYLMLRLDRADIRSKLVT